MYLYVDICKESKPGQPGQWACAVSPPSFRSKRRWYGRRKGHSGCPAIRRDSRRTHAALIHQDMFPANAFFDVDMADCNNSCNTCKEIIKSLVT